MIVISVGDCLTLTYFICRAVFKVCNDSASSYTEFKRDLQGFRERADEVERLLLSATQDLSEFSIQSDLANIRETIDKYSCKISRFEILDVSETTLPSTKRRCSLFWKQAIWRVLMEEKVPRFRQHISGKFQALFPRLMAVMW
jgi:hypothetical protein